MNTAPFSSRGLRIASLVSLLSLVTVVAAHAGAPQSAPTGGSDDMKNWSDNGNPGNSKQPEPRVHEKMRVSYYVPPQDQEVVQESQSQSDCPPDTQTTDGGGKDNKKHTDQRNQSDVPDATSTALLVMAGIGMMSVIRRQRTSLTQRAD